MSIILSMLTIQDHLFVLTSKQTSYMDALEFIQSIDVLSQYAYIVLQNIILQYTASCSMQAHLHFNFA